MATDRISAITTFINTFMPSSPSLKKTAWLKGTAPLMLAPMQGLTNSALRNLFAVWIKPDTLFTEFMRVAPGDTSRRLSSTDLNDIVPDEQGTPLVVQLIGHSTGALVAAARIAQNAGAAHINLNLGCPFGRMTTGLTGGGILQRPELLQELIPAMRDVIKGSFSIKLRSGYNNNQQIFSLLPLFESSAVDFIVLHPRTVIQEYNGVANHAITANVVKETSLPVIANGDIRTAEDGLAVLEETGACGLMLGRGAIADPLLFKRLREKDTSQPDRIERAAMLYYYLSEILKRYQNLFCGEQQILGKVKSIVATMSDPEFDRHIKSLKKTRTIRRFSELLDELKGDP